MQEVYGIRAVTGVETGALPVFPWTPSGPLREAGVQAEEGLGDTVVVVGLPRDRTEERRVGKESRYRW